jgi:cytochrome c2
MRRRTHDRQHRLTKTLWPTGPMIAFAAILAALLLTAVTAWSDSAGAYPEEPWGYDTPAGRCVVCHSLEKGGPFRVAPNLWEIVGADIARDRGWYAYSPALAAKGGTWTADDLDRFLANASAFAPGSTKSIRVENPEERQEIIDFLKTLSD